MSIVPITLYGDNILRQKTKPVDKVDDKIIEIIRNMFDSMRNADGIGLAANQIGLDKSIITIDISVVEDYEKYKPIVFINPEILLESADTVIMEEGCLSLPRIHAEVERAKYLKLRYMDTDENIQEIELDELFARVTLHEFDHLIGKMIPDRVTDGIRKVIKKDLAKIEKRDIDVDYPVVDYK